MTSSTTTGSFWLCPSCKKHVPSRQNTCRCGFDRSQSAALTREVQTGANAAVQLEEHSGSRLRWAAGRVAMAVLVAGSFVWAYRAWKEPASSPGNSDLARRIRAARERWQQGPQAGPALTQPAVDTIRERTWDLPPQAAPATPNINPDVFGALPENDRLIAVSLATRISSGTVPTAQEVAGAEGLVTRYPAEAMVRLLFRSLVVAATEPLRAQRQLPEARQMLERARSVLPGDSYLTRVLMALCFDMADWPAAAALASEVLNEDAADPTARTVFALATAAQGNDRDALSAIYSALDVVRSGPQEATLRNLRDQIERRIWATSGCNDSQLPDPARGGEANERLERFLAMVSSCTGAAPASALLISRSDFGGSATTSSFQG